MHELLATLETRRQFGWMVLRFALAGLIAAHGWTRLLIGGVVPFGDWLTEQGFPLGFAIAAGITFVEIVGTVLLAARRFVVPLTLVFSCIYAMGILLVHMQAGWFVVGHGRNGMEYSVLLIVCLLCVGFQELKPRSERLSARNGS
ncbi:DoxX family protein [Arenimonas sp.]|uniref:DoxX family protein n=1 Tax=Arenimonas sp. TaxID=1872635 RepID=UPI0039E3B497